MYWLVGVIMVWSHSPVAAFAQVPLEDVSKQALPAPLGSCRLVNPRSDVPSAMVLQLNFVYFDGLVVELIQEN